MNRRPVEMRRNRPPELVHLAVTAEGDGVRARLRRNWPRSDEEDNVGA